MATVRNKETWLADITGWKRRKGQHLENGRTDRIECHCWAESRCSRFQFQPTPHTQATLGVLTAETTNNIAKINLVGLAQTCIEYLPVS